MLRERDLSDSGTGPAAPRAGEPLPVTVLIPAYDRAALLPRALASVAAQEPRPPAEVLVVDDGSSDDTAAVAASAGARVVRHERNLGLAAARNTGLEAATQPWVALLDSDDEWLPGHLARLWAIAGTHVVVADSALRCGADPVADVIHGPLAPGPVEVRDPAKLIYPGNMIPVSAAMVRREVALEVGGFRQPAGVADLDLWLRMLERGTALVSEQVGIVYHVHEGQMSQRAGEMQQGHVEVARRFSDRPWWSAKALERWRGRAAWNNVRTAVRRRRASEALAHAAGLVAHPQRLRGAVETSLRRVSIARRSGRIDRDGMPSVALLSRQAEARARATRGLADRRLLDLRGSHGYLRAYLRLLRRPTAYAVAGSSAEGLLLRLAGVMPVTGSDDTGVGHRAGGRGR